MNWLRANWLLVAIAVGVIWMFMRSRGGRGRDAAGGGHAGHGGSEANGGMDHVAHGGAADEPAEGAAVGQSRRRGGCC